MRPLTTLALASLCASLASGCSGGGGASALPSTANAAYQTSPVRVVTTTAAPATPTPAPIANSTIAPGPAASPTATPVPTLAPIGLPSATASPVPTPPIGVPLPTAAPTAAPTPMPTAPPTQTPTAPPTARPTATPTPVPTATPTPKPTATPTPQPTSPPTSAAALICVHFSSNPMCRPLPSNPSISTSSAAWSALNFQSGRDYFGPMLIANVTDPYADSNDGSEPLEELPAGAATIAQTINCNAVGWGVATCAKFGSQGKTWNVPADMMPAGNSDHHFSYDDYSAGGEFDFWLAQQPGTPGSTMSVGGAGFCKWGTDGTNCSDATATNLATSLGGIDATLLQAAEGSSSGTLPYALAGAILCADPSYVYPASASDGANTNSSSACTGATASGARPPEGTRWFLNMTDAQINATNNAPYVKAILRTIDVQHYGGVVTDTNWSGAPGISLQYHRGNFSFAAAEAGVSYGANNTIPITNNGFDPAKAIVFCTNGTC